MDKISWSKEVSENALYQSYLDNAHLLSISKKNYEDFIESLSTEDDLSIRHVIEQKAYSRYVSIRTQLISERIKIIESLNRLNGINVDNQMTEMPSFYGEGLRASLSVRWNILNNLSFSVKASQTRYFNRDVISSGTEQINGNKKTDVFTYLVWKF